MADLGSYDLKAGLPVAEQRFLQGKGVDENGVLRHIETFHMRRRFRL